MRRTLQIVLALLMLPVLVRGQASVAGKWETTAPGPRGLEKITMDFKVSGEKLTGTMQRNDPPGNTPVQLNGKVDRDAVTFTVTSPDGNRTITFTGKLKGDEIEFTRETKGTGGGNGIFGLTGPQTVIAKRVK